MQTYGADESDERGDGEGRKAAERAERGEHGESDGGENGVVGQALVRHFEKKGQEVAREVPDHRGRLHRAREAEQQRRGGRHPRGALADGAGPGLSVAARADRRAHLPDEEEAPGRYGAEGEQARRRQRERFHFGARGGGRQASHPRG